MEWILRRHGKQALGSCACITVRASTVSLYAYPPAYKWSKRIRRWPFGGVLGLPTKAWASLYSPPGDWDLQTSRFSDHPTFTEMSDLHQHAMHWKESQLYARATQELAQTGRFQYKKMALRSAQELDHFFEHYLVGMITSMQQNGYDKTRASDHPGVMIGRNGELIKSPKGRHRWAVASVLNLGGVTAEIDCIHPLWLDRVGGGYSGEPLQRLKLAIEHLQRDHE
jgi:hypothetical protein